VVFSESQSVVIFSVSSRHRRRVTTSVGRLSLLKIIPRIKFLAAMSLMSLAGLLGLWLVQLGGWLVEVATWHWIFLINIPMGVLGILMTLKVMPNVKSLPLKHLIIGFVLLVVAMIGWSLGIEHLASPEYSKWFSISLLVVGIIATLWYAYHSHTHQNALFRSRLFRNKIYAIGILGNFFARFGGNAFTFVLPLMLQVAFGFEPFIAGLMMIP
jgi:hypothetical protein